MRGPLAAPVSSHKKRVEVGASHRKGCVGEVFLSFSIPSSFFQMSDLSDSATAGEPSSGAATVTFPSLPPDATLSSLADSLKTQSPPSPPKTIAESSAPADQERTVAAKGGTHDLYFLPIPRRLQWDPEAPPKFTLLLNVIFGFSATFSESLPPTAVIPSPLLADLACAPISCIKFVLAPTDPDSDGRDIWGPIFPSYQRPNPPSGRIRCRPPPHQSPRRLGATATAPSHPSAVLFAVCFVSVVFNSSVAMELMVGTCRILALVPHIVPFEAVSFLIGLVSVTPQVLLPLAADLSPPERRASAISIGQSLFVFESVWRPRTSRLRGLQCSPECCWGSWALASWLG